MKLQKLRMNPISLKLIIPFQVYFPPFFSNLNSSFSLYPKVGERTVVLIDETGKEIGRGSGYKVAQLQALDDGELISVGSKEIEITGVSSANIWTEKVKQSFDSVFQFVKLYLINYQLYQNNFLDQQHLLYGKLLVYIYI